MGAVSAAGAAGVLALLLALTVGPRTAAATAPTWPNALQDFEHGGLPGVLETRKQGVHRDFRRYYRVAALDLLLVHHGLRPCESSRGDDEQNLETTENAVRAFQASRFLTVNPLSLDAAFWTRVVPVVRPGESGAAVLALRWLLDATDHASRPPLWDAAVVQSHSCSATFDDALLAKLQASSAATCASSTAALSSSGVSQDCWKALLSQQEVAVAVACEVRAPIANTFGAIWVTAWLGITVAFAVMHTDGKGAGRPIAATKGAFQRAVHHCRRVVPLLAMIMCQTLASIGIWSFPHDLVKLILLGLLVSGGAVVVVYLAAVQSYAKSWIGKSLLEIAVFMAGNVGAFFFILLLPYVRGLWLVALLTIIMVLWGLVTMLLTKQRRVIRGVLLIVMCVLGAAGPTLISIVSGLVNKTGLWLAAFAPTGLFAASVLSERLVGHFIVMHCEYTAETQWLLAIMFRLCIELVRFNTALTVLLLSLLAESGFWFLLLHLSQTLVFEVATRFPHSLNQARKPDFLPSKGHADVVHHEAPFTAAEIVLHVDQHPWVYRSRAVMFPIEVTLFLSHLCQLVFVGMPPGVGQGWWIFGLGLIAVENISHEAIGHLLDRYLGSVLPAIPWANLSSHVLALMAGAGIAMSTFAQFGSLWLLYAHHWASCFLDGGRGAGDLYTASWATSVTRITSTLVLGVLAFVVVIHSYLRWIGVFPQVKLNTVVPAEDVDCVADPFGGPLVSTPSGIVRNRSVSARWLSADVKQPGVSPQTSGRLDSLRLENSGRLDTSGRLDNSGRLDVSSRLGSSVRTTSVGIVPPLDSSQKTDSSSPDRALQRACSRTWENTLSALWDDDSNVGSVNATPRVQLAGALGLIGGEGASEAKAASGAHHAHENDKHVNNLLKDLGIPEEKPPTPIEEGARASPNADEQSRLLMEVLAEMPRTPPPEERTEPPIPTSLPAKSYSPPPEQPSAQAPHRRVQPAVSVDPITKEDLAEMDEIEALLRSPRSGAAQAAPAEAKPASAEGIKEDHVGVLLQRTLNDDDINGLMSAVDKEEQEEEEAPPATDEAGEEAAKAAEAAETAKKEEEERQAAAKMVAAEALAEAVAIRSSFKLQRCLTAAETAGVPAEEVAEARRVLAELEREEDAAKSKAEAEAATRAAEEALAAAVQQRSRDAIEKGIQDGRAKGVAEEKLAEARGVVDQLLAEEKAAAEGRAKEAARSQAREKLNVAMRRRSQYELSECIQEAKALEVTEEVVREAESILQELEDEERKNFAATALAQACDEEDMDEIRSKLQFAREAGVHDSLCANGEAKLEALQKREAARAQLRDASTVKSGLPLGAQIARLRSALDGARAAAVPQAELQAPSEHLAGLEAQQRRELAAAAMAEAFAAQDIERTREALAEARAAGVEETQVANVEQGLKNLEEELELAHDKEKLLRRKIENAMAAKNTAEMAVESSEVENLLGEQGVTKALRSVIDEAKKMRLVHRSEVKKAEAVLNEVTADLKRILLAKQQQEQRQAEERLAEDMKAARGEKPTTVLVLEALQQAITASRVFHANTKDAEALLASLTAEYEREKQAAIDGLSKAMDTMDAAGIKRGVELCRAMLLEDTVRNALQQTRGIISSELAAAREAEREERLQKLPVIEALINAMRALGDQQLRQFHNDLQDLKGALRVFCRVRPLNTREKNLGDTVGVTVADPFTVSVQGAYGDPQVFAYDAIFGPTTSQVDVFSECRSLIQSAFDGYNVTIFSYGQTGAGKTWTLYGSGQEPGISPRTCEEVFHMVDRDSDRLDFDVNASMVELYLNDLRDLLNRERDPPKLEFKSHKQPDGSVAVRLDGLHETKVESSEDLAKVVATGLGQRKVKKTNMNADSSRSHLMLVISFKVTDRASGRPRFGKITIVDLAGSERLAKSGVTGEGQKEAIEINKSLTALGDVMMAFTSRSKVIPYRNHKLTQLMQDSLGGTAKTLMFVNISPATSNADETVNALKYASRARCIENDVKKHKSH